jgi:hypothetical protein
MSPDVRASSDAEAAVVVNPSDNLEVASVVEEHADHDVHLLQLHGTFPLEASELIAALAAPSELGEIVALEAAIDARATRKGVDSLLAELMQVWSPARVRSWRRPLRSGHRRAKDRCRGRPDER